MGQICGFLIKHAKCRNAFSFRGLRPLPPHQWLCPFDVRWGSAIRPPL